MKIIITESQVSLLKENSIVEMDLQQLYDRAIKLKKVVSKNVQIELEDYSWFDGLQVSIDRDWGGLPYFMFNIKTNMTIIEDEFYGEEVANEIHDKINDVFEMYFPKVNKNTQYNLTGVWNASISDRHGFVIHI
jgi:hypothetical protein